MHRAVGDMLGALLGARKFHAMSAAHQPAIHHGVGDLGVELQRVTGAIAKRLHRESIAFGQQFAAGRQVEALAMPLIDVIGPIGADHPPSLRWADRVIADLGVALRMRIDAAAEMVRHHLRAEADAEIRLLVAQRHADPVDLAAHEFLIVVGALRAAENRGAGMLVHRLRQRIAKTRRRMSSG